MANFFHGLPMSVENELKLARLAKEAIDVQDACNISGVAHAFARAMSVLCEMGLDTDARNHHPISVMYASKFASLTNSEDASEFGKAYGECKRLASAIE